MKRYLILFILLLCSTLLQAQELVVQSFKLKETELEAKVNPVYDLNREACALIKVAIVGRDVSFDGNIVKTVEHQSGEYYVYMPAGSKRLKVYSASFLPLTIDFPTFDIKLEKNLTYELRIITPQQLELIPEIDRQYLVMTVSPADASVYIDDVLQSIDSDGIVAVELLCGQHKYRVEKLGFKTHEGEINVRPDEKSELTVTLVDNTGIITVESSPVSNANVYINDELCGETPFTSGRLKSGQYQIKVTKAGYYVFSKTVDLYAGGKLKINAELQASFATVTLISSTPDAEIYMDGKFLAKGSWAGTTDPGKHLVELKKKGFADGSEVIETNRGSHEEIRLTELLPIYGVLNVSSSPLNAEVYVDGVKIGTTPLRTNQITIGRHELSIGKNDYATERIDAEIVQDSTVSYSVKLTPLKKTKDTAIAEKPMQTEVNTPATEQKHKTADSKVKDSHFFIGAVAGMNPELSYGAMVGYSGKIGAFIKYRSNFNDFTSSYDCRSDGEVNGGYILTTGKEALSMMTATGGLVFRLAKPLYFYVGAGFGSIAVGWEDISNQWAAVSDFSYKGAAVTAGAIFKFGPVGITLGTNVTDFKIADFEAGISIWL